MQLTVGSLARGAALLLAPRRLASPVGPGGRRRGSGGTVQIRLIQTTVLDRSRQRAGCLAGGGCCWKVAAVAAMATAAVRVPAAAAAAAARGRRVTRSSSVLLVPLGVIMWLTIHPSTGHARWFVLVCAAVGRV
jgi:hypothetical protein